MAPKTLTSLTFAKKRVLIDDYRPHIAAKTLTMHKALLRWAQNTSNSAIVLTRRQFLVFSPLFHPSRRCRAVQLVSLETLFENSLSRGRNVRLVTTENASNVNVTRLLLRANAENLSQQKQFAWQETRSESTQWLTISISKKIWSQF